MTIKEETPEERDMGHWYTLEYGQMPNQETLTLIVAAFKKGKIAGLVKAKKEYLMNYDVPYEFKLDQELSKLVKRK